SSPRTRSTTPTTGWSTATCATGSSSTPPPSRPTSRACDRHAEPRGHPCRVRDVVASDPACTARRAARIATVRDVSDHENDANAPGGTPSGDNAAGSDAAGTPQAANAPALPRPGGARNEPPRANSRTEVDIATPPWLVRAFLLAAATVCALMFGLWMLDRLRSLLTILLISLFLAFAIEPAVNWLAARGMRRGPATGIVFVGLIAVIAAFFGALGTLLVDQITSLVQNAPTNAVQLVDWINRTFGTQLSADDIRNYATEWSGQLEGYIVGFAGNAWGIGTA